MATSNSLAFGDCGGFSDQATDVVQWCSLTIPQIHLELVPTPPSIHLELAPQPHRVATGAT
jgi:hypothetical protein